MFGPHTKNKRASENALVLIDVHDEDLVVITRTDDGQFINFRQRV